ncbi:inositol transport system substrate-binding protein [Variovorax boronicumulans]|uniref:sugar ABC transporter substrate-binding protein n=1 Tax=Variovorax boronicumulans TaxID=436515 RepID=UPI00159E90D3|nr:sugar ABC transporter substrate-binding protein [Variovorax boronicumulans]MDQ0012128.1 inositol transport system substrate-binding protein [Variovorax boronicumulans]
MTRTFRTSRTHLRKAIYAAATLATASLALHASPALADNERVAALFHNMAEPFFVFMNRELQDEARKLKIKLSVVDGQASSPKQSSDVSVAITQGVDGIIIAPTDARAMTPALNEVLADKIPVVTVDRRVDGAKSPIPHVGADNVAGGRMMAEWVVKNFPDGANIVFLTGQPGSSSGIDRAKGVHDAFTKAGPKYKIVAEQTANWARDQGLTVTQNILTSLAGKPPQVILSANDDMALGAVEAIQSAGLAKEGIKVLGYDASPDALKKVRDGEMAVTVEQSPGRQIRTALQLLVGNIRNKTEIKSVGIEPILITKGNISDAARAGELK